MCCAQEFPQKDVYFICSAYLEESIFNAQSDEFVTLLVLCFYIDEISMGMREETNCEVSCSCKRRLRMYRDLERILGIHEKLKSGLM